MQDPEDALLAFNRILMEVVNHHAPVRKFTVRSVNTPWLDEELKGYMKERDRSKLSAISSGLKSDWQVLSRLKMGINCRKRIYLKTVQQASQIPGTGRVRKRPGRQTLADGQVQARDPKTDRQKTKTGRVKTRKNSKRFFKELTWQSGNK